jgi:gliding motility-associated-like protein
MLLSDNLLDCNHDFVDIYLDSYDKIRAINWFDEDGSFDSISDTARVYQPGKYFAEATGKNYCVSTDSFIVEEGDYIFINSDTFYLTCLDPVAEISVPGARDDYLFSWAGPAGFSSDAARPEVDKGGEYYVEIISGECMENTVIMVIEDKALPDIGISYEPVIGCDPAYARLSGTINEIDYLSFEWSGPGFFNENDLDVEVTEPGTYLFSVTGNNGCADTLYAEIILSQDKPEFDAAGNSITCQNPVVPIRAFGVEQHSSFYWEGPEGYYSASTEPLVDLPGAYKLVVTGHNKCRDSMTIFVTADTIKPQFVIIVTDSLNCANNKTMLRIDSLPPDRQYSYHWSTDSGIIDHGANTDQPSVTGAGVYKITVSDILNGCIEEDSVELQFYAYDLDSVSLTIRHPDCYGAATGYVSIDKVFGGSGPYLFSSDNINYSDINTFSSKIAGSFTIYIKDRYGCGTDSLVVLNEGALVDVQLETDKNDVFPGTPIMINSFVVSPNGISSAKWSPEKYFFGKNDTTPVEIQPLESIYVTLEITDTLGCSGNNSIWIMVKNQLELFIPNIFTPDGDGINDHFYISVKNGVKSINIFKIFNRWGELLYSINNPGLNVPSDGWDGRYRGSMAPQGVYVFFISVELENGTLESFYGDFTLIR